MTADDLPLQHHAMLSLGWALVHFLWQGAVVAGLLAAALAFLRGPTRAVSSSPSALPGGTPSAQARYLAACAALVLMAACPVVTMLAARSSSPAVSRAFLIAGAHSDVGALLAGAPSDGPFVGQPQGVPLRGVSLAPRAEQAVASFPPPRLEPLLPALVAVWLAGVLVLSLRLLGAWAVVQRLPCRATRPISGELSLRVTELARRLGISRSVRLLESAVVPVPTVMGCLRAVILVPAGALSGMPPEQLEALLAHELAHVRRHDTLVNLLQAAVETLLFYHPGVWWRTVRCQVSQQTRMERENCCDDLALAALGDRLTYARALAALEELRRVPPAPALAGNGGDLMARIRRILGMPGGRSETRPAWVAGVILVPLLLATVAVLRASAADGDKANTPSRRAVEAGSTRAGGIAPQWAVYLHPTAPRPQAVIRASVVPGRQTIDTFETSGGRRITLIRVTPGDNTEPSDDDENMVGEPDEEDGSAARDEEDRNNELNGRDLGEQIRRQVRDAVRLAHEQARRAVEEAHRSREQVRRELRRVWPEVERAQEEARRAREKALSELERVRPELERAREEGRRAGERARTELERVRPELERSREEGRRARERARTELDRVRPGVERAQEEARRATEQALAELKRVWPEVERAQEEARRATERALAELRRTLPQTLKSLDRLKDSDCLKALDGLKDLKHLKEFDRLKDLDRLKERPEPEEREEQDKPEND